MSLIDLTDGLITDENGIWKGSETAELSYPEDGNSDCYQLEDTSFWFKHRNECIASIIKQFPPDGPILDVGGGNGYVTRKLLDEGFDAALLEPGETGALNGKLHRHIPDVICATLNEAKFKPASLNAIGCFDVIEHIEDDREFIEQIYSVLAPGGLLYVTLPAHQALWSSSDVSAQHYRRYNQAMVQQLLFDKFEMPLFTYFFGILTPLIFTFRTLPHKLGLSRSILSSETEHGTKQGFVQKTVDFLLRKELENLRNGNTVSVGAHCLFVARKKDD